jgi:AcrR family transcriptional regulator
MDSLRRSSPRQEELLELAYAHVVAHGLSDLSLRPLATAIGSSPRVLLYLFASKDGLTRAVLDRARRDELAAIEAIRRDRGILDLMNVALEVWDWLSAPVHHDLLNLWLESYARSLVQPDGPWADFAESTVRDWLDLLASQQSPARRRSRSGETERTAVLALLRGAMLDVLATGDLTRVTRAVTSQLNALITVR